VIIIGAGLGGCATALAMRHAGFKVTMFEKVRAFQRLGDSLGLGENAFKLLDRWSPLLRDRLIEIGNKSEFMQIRRWHDGEILAKQPLMDMAGYIGHRGDYHKGFLDAVAEKGVEVRMGMEVSLELSSFSFFQIGGERMEESLSVC
jgi:salicylate hydroxylase